MLSLVELGLEVTALMAVRLLSSCKIGVVRNHIEGRRDCGSNKGKHHHKTEVRSHFQWCLVFIGQDTHPRVLGPCWKRFPDEEHGQLPAIPLAFWPSSVYWEFPLDQLKVKLLAGI